MKRSIVKPIIGGVLIGLGAFFAPWLLCKIMLFFFIVGGIFRLIFWSRMGRWGHPRMYMAYADKIRGMNEEEYSAFKGKMNDWSTHCGHRHHQCGSYYEMKKEEQTEIKK